MGRPHIIPILLLAVAMGGCIDGPQDLQETRTIPAGGYFEINLIMRSGDALDWSWNATDTLRHDVHTHFDGQVQVLHEEQASHGSGALTAARNGGHSLMWRNSGADPVDLQYALSGSFRLDSYHPA
jgi:hypothetical protein